MKILILGASVRAAAFSTRRASRVPMGVDLFADRDLVAIAETEQVSLEDYPERLIESRLVEKADAWFFTGAIENYPALVDRLASRLPLIGNDAAVLRQVRDPFELSDRLSRAGFSVPRIGREGASLEKDGRWLLKPLRSGGGRGILPWSGKEDSESCYFQEWLEGKSLSATYIGHSEGATLQGICEQAIGHPGASFGYRGSLGPWPVSDLASERIAELGGLLARSFQVRGLFGVDFILQGDEPWVVEVNPRYTASVEILELAYRSSILAEHFEVFSGSAPRRGSERKDGRLVAKEVLFADAPVRYDDGDADNSPDPFASVSLADIPQLGMRFDTGDPIVTVFGQGGSIEECRADLERNKTIAASYLSPFASDS